MPTIRRGMTLHVEGLRWHGPISVVGAPSRSECYGVVAPPKSWDRGIRNAAHCTPSTGLQLAPTRVERACDPSLSFRCIVKEPSFPT